MSELNNKDSHDVAQFTLVNEQDTTRFAQAVAQAYEFNRAEDAGLIVYLNGDLGAGKSFFSRAFIQYFIAGQKVKSPTYNIVESYSVDEVMIHHFDLYRLCDPEELEYLAIRDLLVNNYVALVEWPQKGVPILPEADMIVEMQHPEEGDEDGRLVTISGVSLFGNKLVEQVVLNMSKN